MLAQLTPRRYILAVSFSNVLCHFQKRSATDGVSLLYVLMNVVIISSARFSPNVGVVP
jgi:hypothetical protein